MAFSPGQTVKHASQSSVTRKDGNAYVIETLGADGRVGPHAVDRVIGEKPLWQFIVDAEEGHGAGDSGRGGDAALAEPVAPDSAAQPVAPDDKPTQSDSTARQPIPRQQVLELCYDPAKHEWFNVYGDEDRQPGEWGHWTGRGMNWNSQCASCHNTRVKKNYDPATDTYATTMAEPTVSCEACHGPMRDHVDWQRTNNLPASSPSPAPRAPRPSTDPTLKKFTSTQWLAICGSCHARQTDLTGDFVPGDSYFDHYALVVPDLSETFYADGQVREENYEFTSFLSSRMYASGVTCLHCHDPHAAKPVLNDNALCMKCHNGSFPKSPKIDVATHTFHAAESSGSKCVNCHMPQTVYMQRHWRHDHGFTIPDPLLTKQHGIPNACNRCHEDKDVDWSLAAVEKWYGERMNRPTRRRAQLVAALRKGATADHAAPLLAIVRDKENVFWQAAALTLLPQDELLRQPEVQQALVNATGHGFPLVRDKTVGSLGPLVAAGFPNADAAVRKLLEDPTRSVRVAAAWTLRATVDETSLAAQDALRYQQLSLDQPIGLLRSGEWLLARGDRAGALTLFEKAVAWNPSGAQFRNALAEVYSLQERPADAVRQLQQAVKLEPKNAQWWFGLGQAWAEVGDLRQASASFEKAVELDPTHSDAWYNLGLALDQGGKTVEGVAALAKAERLNARRADIPFALATILAKHGHLREAREAAMRALQANPNHQETRQLLQNLGGLE